MEIRAKKNMLQVKKSCTDKKNLYYLLLVLVYAISVTVYRAFYHWKVLYDHHYHWRWENTMLGQILFYCNEAGAILSKLRSGHSHEVLALISQILQMAYTEPDCDRASVWPQVSWLHCVPSSWIHQQNLEKVTTGAILCCYI